MQRAGWCPLRASPRYPKAAHGVERTRWHPHPARAGVARPCCEPTELSAWPNAGVRGGAPRGTPGWGASRRTSASSAASKQRMRSPSPPATAVGCARYRHEPHRRETDAAFLWRWLLAERSPTVAAPHWRSAARVSGPSRHAVRRRALPIEPVERAGLAAMTSAPSHGSAELPPPRRASRSASRTPIRRGARPARASPRRRASDDDRLATGRRSSRRRGGASARTPFSPAPTDHGGTSLTAALRACPPHRQPADEPRAVVASRPNEHTDSTVHVSETPRTTEVAQGVRLTSIAPPGLEPGLF